MLKDHLGNVRMVLTEEIKQNVYPAATLEDIGSPGPAVDYERTAYYDINTNNVVGNEQANGIPAYNNNNGFDYNHPVLSSTQRMNTQSQKLYKLNSTSAKTGLGIAVKVMAGDKLDIFGMSYHDGSTGSTSGLDVPQLLAGFIGAPGSAAAGKLTGIQAEAINPLGSALYSFLQNRPPPVSSPKAYINYIFFDEQFKFVSGGCSMVKSSGGWKQHYEELQNIAVPKNGYVYVFCSNETDKNVFFDNLQLIHTQGPLLEETHYYPFGLTMNGISSKALNGIAENKNLFLGSELQSKEFSDGSGLELYDMNARHYDQQIGRFNGIDILSENFYGWSPYSYSFNNPLKFTDPTGMAPMSTHIDKDGNVLAVFLDGDLGVYQHGDNADGGVPTEYMLSKRAEKQGTSSGGTKIGETEYIDEFISPEDGTTMTNYRIQVGKSFDPIIADMHAKTADMDLIDIAQQSKPGKSLDIKQKYKNVGALLNGKYATSRSAGNFLAGYNAEDATYLGMGISFKTFQKLAGALHIEGGVGAELGKGQMADIVITGHYTSADPNKHKKFVAPAYGEVNYQYRMSKAGWDYGKKK